MKTFHYVITEAERKNKKHHITIVEGLFNSIEIFYNQAIHCVKPAHISQEKWEKWSDRAPIPNMPDHYDFYEESEVVTRSYNSHGYSKYIKQAIEEYNAAKAAAAKAEIGLEVGDVYSTVINQGSRDCEVLEVSGEQALMWYEMPNGRSFLNIVDRKTKGTIRSCSVNAIPKRFLKNNPAEYFADFVNSWTR